MKNVRVAAPIALLAVAAGFGFARDFQNAPTAAIGFAALGPVSTAGKMTTVGLSGDKTILTLTDGGMNEASSVWTQTPQAVSAFTAEFTYQAAKAGGADGGMADGFAFVLQNDPRAGRALGDEGNALGYGGSRAQPIAPSVAVAFNLYEQPGEAVCVDGGHGVYADTAPVDLDSGHPIRITLEGDGATVQETLHDLKTGESCTLLEPLNLAALHGKAYVGFTAASGGTAAIQTIRDFRFTSRSAVPLASRRRIPGPAPKVHNSLNSYVDPLIGTAADGNCYPGAVAPFGMVQFSPDTNAHSIGYRYGDRKIEGFSLTHMSGVGCDAYGDVFLTATTGAVKTDVADYASPFSHRRETASPGYYQAQLLKPNVDAEFTATTHAGVARFTFPAGQSANILVPISHTLTYTEGAKLKVIGDHGIEGQVTSKSFCGAKASYTVYFVMELDQPFASCGTFSGANQSPGGRIADQADKEPAVGAWVSYPKSDKTRAVTARIGISFVDAAGARKNLATEVGARTFDAIRRQTEADWEKNLKVVEVTGGSDERKTVFYTALYHCLLMPNVFSDVDGRYIGFDRQVHQAAIGRPVYADYSGWDIYRTEAPLLALIAPDRMRDMCESVALMYTQGGWIDRWPQANTYTNVMCGSPLTTMVATAWNYGLRDFDMKTAYQGMYKDATAPAPPGKPYQGQSNIVWMDKLGYIPDDKEGYGSVSQTEEDCIAYAALGSVAQSLGKATDASLLNRRALNYRNLYDPVTKFFRPKLADGSWYAPFDPTQDHGYVEGSGWHYRFLAPQDVAGMITLFGGGDAFNTAMDDFFDFKTPSWNNRFYNPYNETDLQAPFLYDYAGTPWKTQSLVRRMLSSVYKTTPDGIPGNDDCGTMSAWAVFAMLGLYPTDPARPAFELCSPVFPKVVLHLAKPYAGKTLTILAPAATSAANAYVQSVRWNGAASGKPWVSQTDLAKGGSLTFGIAKEPNKAWGSAPAARPPSLSGRQVKAPWGFSHPVNGAS